MRKPILEQPLSPSTAASGSSPGQRVLSYLYHVNQKGRYESVSVAFGHILSCFRLPWGSAVPPSQLTTDQKWQEEKKLVHAAPLYFNVIYFMIEELCVYDQYTIWLFSWLLLEYIGCSSFWCLLNVHIILVYLYRRMCNV